VTDNPLNAQQIQQIQNEASKALQAAVDRLQLRKWAVEQAFELYCSPNILAKPPLPHTAGGNPALDPMTLANAVYDFVVKAAVVKVEIGD
jgi:hypothetical protein